MSHSRVLGRSIVRNSALNFLGLILPLGLAIFTVPFIIGGLGVERYGIWSLAMIVIGYFALVDLGLSRAMTKFVSELLGLGNLSKIPKIFWTCLASQLILGVLGAGLLMLLTPYLTSHFLNIPEDFQSEAKSTFYLIGVSIPIVLCSAALNSSLEAQQRFDLINAVKVPSNCLVSLSPVAGIWFGFHLPGIVVLVLLVRLATLFVLFVLCLNAVDSVRKAITIDLKLLPELLQYGGWITVIVGVSSILLWIDKALVGAILTVESVGYYTPAHNVTSYLLLIPTSLFFALFPVASSLGSTARNELEALCNRAIKYILILVGPIALILIVFADDFLAIWLGEDFSARSTGVLQILSIGFFLNSLQWIPAMLLQSVGKPSTLAKIYMLELPFYLVLTSFMIQYMGIQGAAASWAIRGGVEALIVGTVTWRKMGFNFTSLFAYGLDKAVLSLFALIITTIVVAIVFPHIKIIQAGLTVGLFTSYAFFIWNYSLEVNEKSGLKSALFRFGKQAEIPI